MPTASISSRLTITEEVGNYYDRTLLDRLLPNLTWTKFGQVREIPRKFGSYDIKFRRYESFSAATTALSEGTTPTGQNLDITDVNATVAQYGDWCGITDVVDFLSPDPVLTEAAELLGEQAGNTLDVLARDVLIAGTTVTWGYADVALSVVAGATSCVAPTSYISANLIKKSVRTLQTNNAKKITRIVNPSTGYGTNAINAAYVGLVHPKTVYTLKGLTGWTSVEDYGSQADVMPGEVGALDEVRFVMSQNGSYNSGGGSGSCDVYKTVILAANAYGISRISGEAIRNIVKPLGSAGTADPLDQRATSGWKGTFVAKILNENALCRIEHAVE
jgi:N4-gp56 family major capsid protein